MFMNSCGIQRRACSRIEGRDPSTALPRAPAPGNFAQGDREKSRDQGIGPGIELAGCPDKLRRFAGVTLSAVEGGSRVPKS